MVPICQGLEDTMFAYYVYKLVTACESIKCLYVHLCPIGHNTNS